MAIIGTGRVFATLMAATALTTNSTPAAAIYQWWHVMTGATQANQQWLKDGKGVRVGILDGLAANHSEFGNRLFKRWIFTNGTYNFDDDHGTHVTGIVGAGRNGFGMVGIAPGAKMTNFAVFDDFGFPGGNNATLTALDRVKKDKATIANMSYGPTQPGLLAHNADLSAIAQHRKSLFISKAAGNDGRNLKKIVWNSNLTNMIIVGSVGQTKQISSFSNRPGNGCFRRAGEKKCRASRLYMRRFIVAPGEAIYSTLPPAFGNYGFMSGTSMAAPMVAGAAALLQSRWKFLKKDPKKTVDILLKTAEDLGKKGIDKVYGRGLLRIDRAMKSKGKTKVAVSSTVNGTSHDFSSSSMTMSSMFGNTLGMKNALQGMVVFDKFDRDFQVDVNTVVQSAPSMALSLENRLQRRMAEQNQFHATMPIGSALAASLTFSAYMPVSSSRRSDFEGMAPQEAGLYGLNEGRKMAYDLPAGFGAVEETPAWRLAGNVGSFSFGFGRQTGLTNELSQSETGGLFLFDATSFSLPATALEGKTSHGFVRYQLSDKLGFGVGFAETKVETGFATADTGPSSRTYLARADFTPVKGIGVHLTHALLDESQMVFGSVSSGALSFGQGAATHATGVGLSFDLPASFGVRLQYTHGTTDVSRHATSLFRSVDTLQSHSYGVSLFKSGVFMANDEIGFSVSRPMHIVDGNVVVDTPVGRTVGGQVKYASSKVSLAPEALQTDFDIGYRAMLSPNLSVGVNFFYQHQLDNLPGEWGAGGLAQMRLTF